MFAKTKRTDVRSQSPSPREEERAREDDAQDGERREKLPAVLQMVGYRTEHGRRDGDYGEADSDGVRPVDRREVFGQVGTRDLDVVDGEYDRQNHGCEGVVAEVEYDPALSITAVETDRAEKGLETAHAVTVLGSASAHPPLSASVELRMTVPSHGAVVGTI